MRGKPTIRRKRPRAESTPPRAVEPGGGAAPESTDAAAARPTPPSEDFGRRRDIETADEPAGEHDRRFHDRGKPA